MLRETQPSLLSCKSVNARNVTYFHDQSYSIGSTCKRQNLEWSRTNGTRSARGWGSVFDPAERCLEWEGRLRGGLIGETPGNGISGWMTQQTHRIDDDDHHITFPPVHDCLSLCFHCEYMLLHIISLWNTSISYKHRPGGAVVSAIRSQTIGLRFESSAGWRPFGLVSSHAVFG